MTAIEESILTADRVLNRAQNGVATFRLMNAAEEPHVIRALYHWRGIAYEMPDLLAENEALRAEVETLRRQITALNI